MSTPRFLAIIIAVLLVIAAAVVLTRAASPPEILDIRPGSVSPGEHVVVVGDNFGSEGRLEIDGIGVAPEDIVSWNDGRVVFRFPDRAKSGAVTVETMRGQSNSRFVVSETQLPEDAGIPIGAARIDDAPLSDFLPGLPVVIHGANFGPPTGRSTLQLSGTDGPVTVAADSPYVISWTDNRIEFLVPAGVRDGTVRIAPLGFDAAEVEYQANVADGTIEYGQVSQLGINQTVAVDPVGVPGRIWIPNPPELAEQPSVQVLTTQETGSQQDAWWEFKVGQRESDESATTEVGTTVLVRRRATRVTIDGADLPDRFFLQDPAVRRGFHPYLDATPQVPTDHKEISFNSTILANSIPRGASQLQLARRIYDHVLETLEPVETGPGDAIEAYRTGEGSPFAYASLFTAMLRSQGIPARRHAGVAVLDSGEAALHYWVEFFLLGFGWYPADPAIGDGMFLQQTASYSDFYGSDRANAAFGGVDSRRVTLAVDGREPDRRYPGLPYVAEEPPYALSGPLYEAGATGTLPGVRFRSPRLLTITRMSRN